MFLKLKYLAKKRFVACNRNQFRNNHMMSIYLYALFFILLIFATLICTCSCIISQNVICLLFSCKQVQFICFKYVSLSIALFPLINPPSHFLCSNFSKCSCVIFQQFLNFFLIFADSASAEYCSTFQCPSVRPCVTGVTSQFSTFITCPRPYKPYIF